MIKVDEPFIIETLNFWYPPVLFKGLTKGLTKSLTKGLTKGAE